MNSLFAFIAIALLSSHAFAETVKLKNGTVLKGVIVEMNQTDLIIDTAEMGRVTVKRFTIQKISDDEGTNSGGSGTVINVNNSNQVEQKNEQSNSQVNTQTNAGSEKSEARRWRQGLQGRFHLSQESVNFKEKDEGLEFPKTYGGFSWDLLGFRSESWWAVYLELSSQGSKKDNVDYTYGGTMVRLDWNAFKSVNGDTLSLVYFGLGVGTGTFEAETTDINGRKTSLEFSGSRTSLRVGYDYFWGRYWGLSAFAAVNSTTFSSVTYKIDGEDVVGSSLDEVSAGSTSFGLGLLYNIDL